MTQTTALTGLRHDYWLSRRGSDKTDYYCQPRTTGSPVGLSAWSLRFHRSLSQPDFGFFQPCRPPSTLTAQRPDPYPSPYPRDDTSSSVGVLTRPSLRGGCSSMVEPLLPKQMTRVRFPSPAPFPTDLLCPTLATSSIRPISAPQSKTPEQRLPAAWRCLGRIPAPCSGASADGPCIRYH